MLRNPNVTSEHIYYEKVVLQVWVTEVAHRMLKFKAPHSDVGSTTASTGRLFRSAVTSFQHATANAKEEYLLKTLL